MRSFSDDQMSDTGASLDTGNTSVDGRPSPAKDVINRLMFSAAIANDLKPPMAGLVVNKAKICRFVYSLRTNEGL